MKHFSFISDTINEKLRQCGFWMFSLKGNKQDIVHQDGETMCVGSTLTDEVAHLHAHGHAL